MKGIVVYHSRTGITKKFGEEIKAYLQNNSVSANIVSIGEFRKEQLGGVDCVFLGCWTSGLMILLQHPEKEWITFSQGLPDLGKRKLGFFTTYKMATGGMFKKMKKYVVSSNEIGELELKSKTGFLSESDKNQLLNFIK
jgi:flavodoxin